MLSMNSHTPDDCIQVLAEDLYLGYRELHLQLEEALLCVKLPGQDLSVNQKLQGCQIVEVQVLAEDSVLG